MAIIEGGVGASSQLVVDNQGRPTVKLPTADADAGKVRVMSENDPGAVTGSVKLMSPETSGDFRLRVGVDQILDSETFNYAAQFTGKHVYRNTTMAAAWGGGAITTNSASITTTTTGVLIQTYRFFPIFGASTTYAEASLSFTNTPVTNTIVDFGLFQAPTANPYAPTDGVFFRLTSAGLSGVISVAGSETTTSITPFTVTPNRVYKFNISINERLVEFWIDDVLYGSIAAPISVGQCMMAGAAPWSVRHVITGGAAGGVFQVKLFDYTVSIGDVSSGRVWAETAAEMGLVGYQGQAGHTQGQTGNWGNSTNPTAAVPTNTTAALGTGLGGHFWETDTLAVGTDGIITSFLNPASTTAITGRTLIIKGVWVDSFVQAALTGGGYVAQWCLAFGHNALSLATSEAATSKAPRRIPIGIQSVPSGAALSTVFPRVYCQLRCPAVVMPGEYVQVVKRKATGGTAPSAGTIAHIIGFDAQWI